MMIGLRFTWKHLYEMGYIFMEEKDGRHYFLGNGIWLTCKFYLGAYTVESTFKDI